MISTLILIVILLGTFAIIIGNLISNSEVIMTGAAPIIIPSQEQLAQIMPLQDWLDIPLDGSPDKPAQLVERARDNNSASSPSYPQKVETIVDDNETAKGNNITAGNEAIVVSIEDIATMAANLSRLSSNDSFASDTDYFGKKAVILAFDDGWKSQFTYAKPILDEFDFKATFFVVCDYVEDRAEAGQEYMSWSEVVTLHKEGHNLESHSMSHKLLSELSQRELDYEVGQSKECLNKRGINSTIFATPSNIGWDNRTVIDTIAKHYNMAKNGNDPLMYLHCDGWSQRLTNQTDCRTYNNDDGELNFANRYSIRAWSHNYYDGIYNHNNSLVFAAFIEELQLAVDYNSDKKDLEAVPILQYHKVDFSRDELATDPHLFYAEMQFLHENGFDVLTMADLEYDEEANSFFIPKMHNSDFQ